MIQELEKAGKLLSELPVCPSVFIVHSTVYKLIEEQWGTVPDCIHCVDELPFYEDYL